LLIAAVIVIAARYAIKLFRPVERRKDSLGGAPQSHHRAGGSDKIEDVDFKEISDK
jgi:hypothetical protein